MKPTSIIALCIGLLFFCLSCNQGPKVTIEEVGLAFGVTTRAFMSANLGFSFNQKVENADYDEDTGIMTFSDFSFDTLKSNLKSDFEYTSMSGTVSKGIDNTMVADLTLTGGPVKSIKYQTSVQIFNGILPEYFDVTVNGIPMKLKPSEIY